MSNSREPKERKSTSTSERRTSERSKVSEIRRGINKVFELLIAPLPNDLSTEKRVGELFFVYFFVVSVVLPRGGNVGLVKYT